MIRLNQSRLQNPKFECRGDFADYEYVYELLIFISKVNGKLKNQQVDVGIDKQTLVFFVEFSDWKFCFRCQGRQGNSTVLTYKISSPMLGLIQATIVR